jgi:membrane fusion protein, multidrug efflux system
MSQGDDEQRDDEPKGEGNSSDDRKASDQDAKPDSGADDNDDDKQDKNKPDKPPLWKRPLFWIIAIVVVAVVIVGGFLWWSHARKYESTDDAFVDAHIVRLSPQIAGQLVWVAPSDNRHVKAGQLLAVIEPSGPEAQLEQARAGVAEADAGIAQAEGRLIAARAQWREAIANARAPAAEAGRSARDAARFGNLAGLDRAAVAETQLDQARTQARTAAAQAAAARRQIATARANMLVAEKGIEAARAQRTAAVARVSQARVTTGDLRITAPIDGQVVQRNVNVGSTVSPQTQMMAIVPDQIWVTANFKETQLTHMALRQPVEIRIDAYPDQSFPGHIDSIQRGAGQAFGILPPQNATGNYVKVVQRVPVRIVFDRMPDPRRFPIGPGMSVVPQVKVR